MSEGHQFKTPRISIRGPVRPSFRPSVHPQGRYAISKTAENKTIRGGLPSKTFLTIYNNNNDDNVDDDDNNNNDTNNNNNDDNAGEMG